MSSRRKSSTPCMVRVISDLPDERDDTEEAMDIETLAGSIVTEKELTGSSEPVEKTQQESVVHPDEVAFPKQAEQQSPEPLEQEEHSSNGDQPPVIVDVVGRRVKDKEGTQSDPVSQKKQPRGYECKYCPFLTQNLNDFKEHVDSSHPNVILNPLYLCAVCNFNTKKFDSLTEHNESQHPGEINFKFKRIKMNNQTILEQTIEGKDKSAECELTNEQGESHSTSVFSPCLSTTVKTPGNVQSLYGGTGLKSPLNGLIQKDQITAVNINGTVIIPEPTILQGLSHVTPMLQRPPNFNSVPKIAVPLNTTKYNPSLDDNLTLITSFNKFPYPTHAELSWLTAASKHPEEQIKVWFTTQRLKQGITWSPEEVEEARKKMFNGSIPPAHHTFTILPTSPVSQSSAKASKQPVVHTTVEHPGRFRTTVSNGLSVVSTTNSSNSLKRCAPTHLTSVFGPESKRPIMAVAPHSGDPKDKILMAPPPPPPPQKDRFPMAPPPVPVEIKRPVAAQLVNAEMKRSSVAVPLMPPPSSLSPSSSSKGKILSATANSKIKPVVSLRSIVFPESLTRPLIVPSPIFAPFKNSLLIPRTSRIISKEKQANTHSLPASDSNLPNSPPLNNSQVRRPTIIQSVRTPATAPSQIQGFLLDGKILKEHQGMELKASYPKGDKVVSPLAEANGTSRMDGKWSHDQISAHSNGIIHLDGGEMPAIRKSDFQHKSSVLTQFPLLERMKGKTAKQLKILEENFLRNSFPSHSDVDNLAATTGLSHQEIDSWFVERRALRDNLEQALLNSMGTKRMGIGGIAGITEKPLHQQQQQHQNIQLNGIHKISTSVANLKSPPPPSHVLSIIAPSAVAPSIPNPNSCSVPPDSRSLALLKDDFAQTRWPSPEELSQLEGRTGLAHSELARWFTDTQLQSSGMELTELFHNNGMNGGQGQPVCSPESTPPSIIQRCQEGAVTNNNKVLELELGWLMDQRSNSLNSQQHAELQERFAGRLRQQRVAELKNGGQNGGVMGGAREVFGSWLEDGHLRRGRELLLDRERKMAEDTSGRLTG
ncbi:zinc fingers and homeoboxes protein 2-like isoform 1-T5 [Odontesthes bonariensis]|uniref:zinc fingers and homeoboxes protein 2-like n=1 Tax=Odontesthes bonariensis TaxID=219752 RepID=UPI003F58F013